MLHHRDGGGPSALPDPDSFEYHAQKRVLLELVVTPPPGGDRLACLVEYLPVPARAIEPAVPVSVGVGLAERQADHVRATPTARYFEYLWPAML